MTVFLYLLFASVCCFLFMWGLVRSGRTYQFPFLAGSAFGAVMLPEFVGLYDDYALPIDGLNKALGMCILCSVMCYFGYALRPRIPRVFHWELDENRLLVSSIVLTASGAYFFFCLTRLPDEIVQESQWTGTAVAYHFLSQALVYGFAIACLLYLRNRSALALFIIAVGALFFLDRIVIGGRRAVTAQFVLIVLCSLWFCRRWAVPRPVMVGAIVAGSLACFSIGHYRDVMQDGRAYHSYLRHSTNVSSNALRAIPFVDRFVEILQAGGPGARGAVYEIAAKDYTQEFDYGLWHWNRLVFNFVPGQVFGHETKQSLIVPIKDDAWTVYAYDRPAGLSILGISDAFNSFWYFGCIKFLAMGYAFKIIYSAAIRESMVGQLAYTCVIHSSITSILQDTHYFLLALLTMVIFVLPWIYWSKCSATTSSVNSPTPISSRYWRHGRGSLRRRFNASRI